ncbi:hypothetical protein ACFL17_07065 [Pseudomonadota bacterium]
MKLNLISVAEQLIEHRANIKDKPWQADLGKIREAANMMPGERPLRINVAKMAETHRPKSMVVDGGSDDVNILARMAYQVIYPDGSIMLESGMDKEIHKSFGKGREEPYFVEENDKVQQALRESIFNVVTHEHGDHMAGVAITPHFDEIAPKTLLTTVQAWSLLEQPHRPQMQLSEEQVEKYRIFDYEDYFPLAAGMVLLKSEGHSPGSQMVYIIMQSGKEYLLIGDCAWHMDGVIKLKHKNAPWVKENREAILCQLEWLNEIYRTEKNITIIVGHDNDQFEAFRTEGLLGSEFELKAH